MPITVDEDYPAPNLTVVPATVNAAAALASPGGFDEALPGALVNLTIEEIHPAAVQFPAPALAATNPVAIPVWRWETLDIQLQPIVFLGSPDEDYWPMGLGPPPTPAPPVPLQTFLIDLQDAGGAKPVPPGPGATTSETGPFWRRFSRKRRVGS